MQAPADAVAAGPAHLVLQQQLQQAGGAGRHGGLGVAEQLPEQVLLARRQPPHLHWQPRPAEHLLDHLQHGGRSFDSSLNHRRAQQDLSTIAVYATAADVSCPGFRSGRSRQHDKVQP